MTIRVMLFLFGMLLAAGSRAADLPLWQPVAGNENVEYAFKRGSCQVAEYVSCIEQRIVKATHTVSFAIAIIRRDTCVKGFGKLATTTLDGEKVLGSSDVVAGGQSIASTEFDFLCLLATTST